MPESDLASLEDEALREEYKKTFQESSETRRFEIAEELENRGLVVPIPEDEGSSEDKPTDNQSNESAEESSTEKPAADNQTEKSAETNKEDKKQDPEGKAKSKSDKDEKKAESKTTFSVVGFDKQQIVHNLMDRTCRKIGLKYVKAQEMNVARKTLSSGSAVVGLFEYDQSNPDEALEYCKLANKHQVPPVLMGRFYKTDVLLAMRAGVADIIKKPMDQEFLKLKIQNLLQKTGQSSAIGGKAAVEKIDFGGRKTPDEKAALLVQKAKELLALPHAVTETIRICNTPDTDMKELELPISSDPALSSLILRRANSAASASNRRITHIQDAVVRIGRKEVKTLALTLSVFNMFSKKECTFGFNRQMYWVHALATAITAKILASFMRDINPEDAFLGGLLHDLGKIIFDDYMNKEYQQVIGQAGSKNLRMGHVEMEIFAMDHAMLGARVAENWKLPDTVAQSIRLHHKPDQLFNPESWGEEGQPIIPQAVSMANSIVKAMRLGHSGDFFADDIPPVAWEGVFPKAMPAGKIVAAVMKELNDYAQFLKINLRAAFVDVNMERKEGVALVAKDGLGPLFRFFFESYGYASQYVTIDKLLPGEGVAYLGLDSREIEDKQTLELIDKIKDSSTKLILICDKPPCDQLPVKVKAPQPVRDFLQIQCALES